MAVSLFVWLWGSKSPEDSIVPLVYQPINFLIRRDDEHSWWDPPQLFPPHPQFSPEVKQSGSLHVFTGAMFSGKTTRLCTEISKYADISEYPPLMISHVIDNRDDRSAVSSHSSQFKGLSHKVASIKVARLGNVDVSKYPVIGIDEAQFFPDLYEMAVKWSHEGHQVYVAGLDGKDTMEPFGQIASLLHKAETFTKVSGCCSECMKLAQKPIIMTNIVPGPFSLKLVGNCGTIDVGGADKYTAVCRAHHPSGRG